MLLHKCAGLDPIVDVDLAVDVGQVTLDGSDAQVEPVGDLVVAQLFGHQAEYFHLASC